MAASTLNSRSRINPRASPSRQHTDRKVDIPFAGKRQGRLLGRSTFTSNRHILIFAVLVAIFGAFQIVFLFSSMSKIVPVQKVETSGSNQGQRDPLGAGGITSSLTLAEVAPFQPSATVNEQCAIPRILIFTHYRDLLDLQEVLTDEEEIFLAANIRSAIQLHPEDTHVRFLTDEQCIASLQKTYPSLVPHFQREEQGMYKADICRGSALYESGGIYLDVDVGVRKNLWLDLGNRTEFVTSLVHRQSNYPQHFFQAILGAAPKSPIIYKYLELFEDHYTGRERVEKGPLGVILLRRAWDRVYDKETRKPVTELYQEMLYNRKVFPDLHPAPTWGTRRACHFVVVATANNAMHAEMKWKSKHFHVPLYSRIAGSRMCPIQTPHGDKHHKHEKKE